MISAQTLCVCRRKTASHFSGSCLKRLSQWRFQRMRNSMVDTLQPRFGAGAQPQKPSKSSRGLVPIVDFAVGNHLRATLFLLVCALLLFLPGFFSIPAIDRD